jgi:hypothetical protein
MLADMVVGAVRVGAAILEIEGSWYAALCDLGRWNVWELDRFDSPIYTTDDLRTCTCPRGGLCKHLKALREIAEPMPKSADPRRGR